MSKWIYDVTVTAPNGLRVTTSVELPSKLAFDRARSDSAELAQIAASNLAKQVVGLMEEVPF